MATPPKKRRPLGRLTSWLLDVFMTFPLAGLALLLTGGKAVLGMLLIVMMSVIALIATGMALFNPASPYVENLPTILQVASLAIATGAILTLPFIALATILDFFYRRTTRGRLRTLSSLLEGNRQVGNMRNGAVLVARIASESKAEAQAKRLTKREDGFAEAIATIIRGLREDEYLFKDADGNIDTISIGADSTLNDLPAGVIT